jgi:hypothetical protein
MAKAGEIVTLTLSPDQSKQFAAVLGAPDTTLVNMPANRVEVAEYRARTSHATSRAARWNHLRQGSSTGAHEHGQDTWSAWPACGIHSILPF